MVSGHLDILNYSRDAEHAVRNKHIIGGHITLEANIVFK